MSVAEPNDFFKERRSFAEIKQEIFGRYFETWCTIRLGELNGKPDGSIFYIDMHAGDEQVIAEGTEPQLYTCRNLYKTIAKRPRLNAAMQTFFYDRNKTVLEQAEERFPELAQAQELVHVPVQLSNSEKKAQLTEHISTGAPALIFTDPFQSMYAQHVWLQAITLWRSDLFMLLNPESLTKTLAAKKVSQPLTELFGDQLAGISNYCRKEKDKYKRQTYLLAQMISVLQEKGNLTLLFKVNLPDTEQPEHYILFASPHSQSYRAFKETILPYSICEQDGIPVFRANHFVTPQTTLFSQPPKYTLSHLTAHLTDRAGLYKYKSIDKIYMLDNPNTNYSRENYIAAFEQLRKDGKVELLNASTMQTIRKPTPSSVVKYKI